MHDDDQDDVMDIDDELVGEDVKPDEEIPAGFSEVDPITGLPVVPDEIVADDEEDEIVDVI